jgi:GntR family transcriptional regulator
VGALDRLPDLDPADYKPLYVQLSEALAEYVRSGGLAQGDLLPSENELLARYRISRTTIRQAVQRLESLEIARRVRGKGTFVAAPKTRGTVRGFQNLEASLAAQGIPVINRLIFCGKVDHVDAWAADFCKAGGKELFSIRRVKLAGEKPLAVEERLLPVAIAGRFSEDDFRRKPIFDLLEERPENEIVRVAYTITSSPLTEKEAEMLSADRRIPGIRRTGIYFGRDENPLMAGRLTFRADRIELKYEFHKEDDNWGIVNIV